MARKHSECETREGGCGCGDGDGIHMDRWHRWDAGGMRWERVLVVLVGVANMNVVESQCPVAAGSHGESTRAWWTKVGS